MESARIEISGMHCMGCVRTVTNALKRVAGVKEADVLLHENSATIQFDELEASIEELNNAVRDAGYEVGASTH